MQSGLEARLTVGHGRSREVWSNKTRAYYGQVTMKIDFIDQRPLRPKVPRFFVSRLTATLGHPWPSRHFGSSPASHVLPPCAP
jgi:hypothetical protein